LLVALRIVVGFPRLINSVMQSEASRVFASANV